MNEMYRVAMREFRWYAKTKRKELVANYVQYFYKHLAISFGNMKHKILSALVHIVQDSISARYRIY